VWLFLVYCYKECRPRTFPPKHSAGVGSVYRREAVTPSHLQYGSRIVSFLGLSVKARLAALRFAALQLGLRLRQGGIIVVLRCCTPLEMCQMEERTDNNGRKEAR
jgi:hypothetical protein